MERTIKQAVIARIQNELDANVACDGISDSTSLQDDLNIDSLQAVQVIIQLEEEFAVDLPDDAMLSMHTVGDVCKAIQTRLSERGRPVE